MKIIKQAVFLLMLLLCNSYSSNAQSVDQHAADRQQLLTLLNEVENAINNKDIDQIKKNIHPNAFITFQDSNVAHGIEDIQVYFKEKVGGSTAILKSFSTKAFVDAPAEFYGDTATAFGHTIDQFEFATGNAFELQSQWSAALYKQNGQWLLTSLHFSANMFDNPLLNTAKDKLILFTLIAFFIGLFLMFFLAKYWFKR